MTLDEIDGLVTEMGRLGDTLAAQPWDSDVPAMLEEAAQAIKQLTERVEEIDLQETDRTLEAAVKQAFIRALHSVSGNRRAACRVLGISKNMLYGRIDKYNTSDPGWLEKNAPPVLSDNTMEARRREALSRRRSSRGLTQTEMAELRRLVNGRFAGEKKLFARALSEAKGIVSHAAKRLGMTEQSFERSIQDFNVCDPGWISA